MKHIIIIGAGLGGMASAIRLRTLGHDVTLFERNTMPGGKMQEVRFKNYRFDTGPSLLTMPEVVKELFEFAGEKLEKYLELTEPEPLCRYIYPDRVKFDNFRDTRKTLQELGKIAPEDRVSYMDFLNYSKGLYDKTAHSFLFNPLYSPVDLLNLNLVDLFRIDAFQTVSGRVDKYFKSDYLKKFFKRFATYNGSSPFQAPATLNVIPHVEITMGGYYVKGGMYRLSEAMESLLIKMGAKIHYDTAVKQIEINNRRVCGVVLENGEKVKCDLLVSNSDASNTLLNLIPGDHLNRSVVQKQKKIEPSCSGFVMLLGTDRSWNQLQHHNIFFTDEYEQEFREIFYKKKLPEDPTIYVANSSVTDPEDAPQNGSNLFVLVNAPYLTEDQDWDRLKKEYPHKILQKLKKAGLDGLQDSIRFQKLITPVDFQERYSSNRGSIYGTSSNSRMSAFLRPRNKLRQIGGIYLAGGSTHPGGGIPLVLLSARHAVSLMQKYENL